MRLMLRGLLLQLELFCQFSRILVSKTTQALVPVAPPLPTEQPDSTPPPESDSKSNCVALHALPTEQEKLDMEDNFVTLKKPQN